MNDADAGIDQPVRERDVAQPDRTASIGSPMHRDNRNIAAALTRQQLCRHLVGGVTLRGIPNQPHPGSVAACGPGFENARGFHRHQGDQHPMLTVNRDHRRPARRGEVGTRSSALDPRLKAVTVSVSPW